LIAYLAGAASTRGAQIPPPAAEGVQGIGSRFEVLGRIGSGGMGEVFEGRDLALDRPVAIKKMREEFSRDPAERARFLSEARMVAKLRHPGIVEIYAVLEEEGDAYLVFERVEGRTLSEMLRERGRIPFEEARAWLRSACEAVEYAHGQGVVHRDIKPSNIMLSGGRVKVMDFGVARQAKDTASRPGTVAGTPPYMAPEQERGQVRKESDVFALGVCFYELLTGTLPFEGSGAGMLLNKMEGRHVPISGRLTGVPPGLEEAVVKALAADPDRRTRSPSELSAALDALKLL
ncbi:MAG: serine/threonine-protein kinase, partial [Elusimicrobiota bacterium]